MLKLYRDWRENRIFRKSTITAEQWRLALNYIPILKNLSENERERLIRLATIFIYKKNFVAAQDFTLTIEMIQIIALQACLPILNLGFHWYAGWSSVIVYPSTFVTNRPIIDAAGVEHYSRGHLSGEAWQQGPVLLAWTEVENAGDIDGENLVIHEFAHKLDMRNGDANGFPPLHKSMSLDNWNQSFRHAYEDLRNKIENEEPSCIDHYAASEPAEFFAVLSEVFFERPELIISDYPHVYENLAAFYKQDTLQRMQS